MKTKLLVLLMTLLAGQPALAEYDAATEAFIQSKRVVVDTSKAELCFAN